jgi:hypothetical protein
VRSDLGQYNDIKVGDIIETFEIRGEATPEPAGDLGIGRR